MLLACAVATTNCWSALTILTTSIHTLSSTTLQAVGINVPGKPAPPAMSLSATFCSAGGIGAGGAKHAIEFRVPSGTLASAAHSLNYWVALPL